MDAGYENYPDSVKDGLRAEARYDRIRGNHIIARATPYEDKAKGWDRRDSEWGTVGIKARCGMNRGDAPQDAMFPFELLNRDGEQSGWGFKGYDYQAYEVSEGFLLVPRKALLRIVFDWGLPLASCGCVWIPRTRLEPFAKILLDNV